MDDIQEKHLGYAVDLAKEALKGLLLVNGGAATALLALASKGDDAQRFGHAILYFGVGALLTVAVMFVGYLSQLAYANDAHEWHIKHQIIAIMLVVLSLIFSGVGFWSAFVNLG